jgi:hypothetical protein
MRIAFLASCVLGIGLAAGWSCSSEGSDDGPSSSGPGAGGAGGNQAACIEGLQSIALTPADQVVLLDGKSAAPITFTATGTWTGGVEQVIDATSLVWEVTRQDDTPPGEIDDGVLNPNPHAGGLVTVTARDGCDVSGSTTVLFQLDAIIGEPGPDWDGNPVTGEPAPHIVYPSDQTRFPRNLYRTLFQWLSQGFTDFRLVFEGPNSTVTVYTDGVHGLCADATSPAGCWEVDEVAWSMIAGSNAGKTATWTVDALDTSTNPPTVRRSESIEIGFSLQDVEGAIFYWSTTNAGIRRGRISQKDPENYVAGKDPQTVYPVDNAIGCVACHVVSRSGKYIAAATKANTDSLWIYEVTADAPPTPLVTDVPDTGGHGFATISPDDVHVVAAWGGKMWMLDRATGAYIADLPTGELKGTHPDWSPAGGELIFTTDDGDAPGDASLARIPFDNGAWGQPTVFLAPPQDMTLNFPQFSHDAQWIAYNVGKGGHTDDQAQIWLVAATNGEPVELVNANRVVSNEMTDGIHQNSAPTWAPEGDYYWIAFNSQREYGVVRPDGNNQIWVAAVSPEQAANGVDPSYPAFRVPFQGLDEANHRAYWTLDVGDPGGGGGAGGAGPCGEILNIGEVCDPVANCCESGTYCDSADGTTYTCVAPS